MRLYLVDGQWQSYEDLHNNYGYTKQATKNILTFKSTDIDAWGEILINVPGFYTITDDSERWDGEFFVSDHTGWYTMDELGYRCGCMPLEVDTTDLQFYNGTSISKAAKVNFDPPGEGAQVDKYLLQAELERGWLTEEEWAELDWLKGEPEPENLPDFAVLDSTTGEVVHTANVGQVGFIPFTQTYKIANIAHTEFISFNQLFRVPDDSMRFIEEPPNYNTAYFNPGQGNDTMSVPNAWSSSGGTIEVLYPLDSSTEIPYDSTKTYTVKTVFYADGTEVTDADLAPFTVSQYITLSDLNYMGQHVGILILRAGINNPILGNPCGCTYFEENPYIEILFNLTNTGDPNTFGSNDYWASNIRNNNDLQTLQDFGVNIVSGSPNRVSSSNSNFTFTPIGLYGASGEDLGADMNNFYCDAGPNGDWASYMCIWNINAYSTGVYKWKCRITKNS